MRQSGISESSSSSSEAATQLVSANMEMENPDQRVSSLQRVFWENVREGSDLLFRGEFERVCQETLRVDLSSVELRRIFDSMAVGEGSRGLTCHRFCQTVRHRFFLKGLRWLNPEVAESGSPRVPEGFDFDADTATNHNVDGEGWYGPFKDIRASRDHEYHGRYSKERQAWQDSVLHSIVQRTERQPRPWLVFTCGAMGVGKGYALGWMSSQGIFPLENIVHIDPDHFKYVMPEWDAYVRYGQARGDPQIPGSRTHKESCYLQEIALEESLRRHQNIWVDGSLRNAKWFVKVFDDIHQRHPEYRIAIFEVSADEEQIRHRVAKRAKRTGRSVPEALLQDSIVAVGRSVQTLMPQADFLARIDNNGKMPRLTFFSSIDHSGSWDSIQDRFARTLPSLREFPQSLAPMFLERVPGATLILDQGLRGVRDGKYKSQQGYVHLTNGTSIRVKTSPTAWVTLNEEARNLACVPEGTASFVWVYPADADLVPNEARISTSDSAEANLVSTGGFAHFSFDGTPLALNAFSVKQQPCMIEFQDQVIVSPEEAQSINEDRWAEVRRSALRAKGARRYAFLMPQEKLAGKAVSASGGFLYEIWHNPFDPESREYVFFPVASNAR